METTVSSDGTMGFGSDLFYTYQISSILIYNLIKNSFDYHNTYQHKNHFYISFYKNIFTPSKKQYKSTTTCTNNKSKNQKKTNKQSKHIPNPTIIILWCKRILPLLWSGRWILQKWVDYFKSNVLNSLIASINYYSFKFWQD